MGAAMFLEVTIWRLFEYGGGRPSLDGTELPSVELYSSKCAVFSVRSFVLGVAVDDSNCAPTLRSKAVHQAVPARAACTFFIVQGRA